MNQTSIPENVLAAVQTQYHQFDGTMPSLVPQPAPDSSVARDTSFNIPLDTAVSDPLSDNTFAPTSCVTDDTSFHPVGTAPRNLNPLAPSFDPPSLEATQTETRMEDDKLPAYINLLYETTVAQIQDTLDSLRSAKWFATLYLLSGYWQLGMTDRAKERSAFCTSRGLFQFCRMPFGLCGALPHFVGSWHMS